MPYKITTTLSSSSCIVHSRSTDSAVEEFALMVYGPGITYHWYRWDPFTGIDTYMPDQNGKYPMIFVQLHK